jgi:hypothetical protein
MKKFLAVAALTLTVVIGGCSVNESPKTSDRIEEDDPRWDCRTMGNRICGEDLPVGVVLVDPDLCPLYVATCTKHVTPAREGF